MADCEQLRTEVIEAKRTRNQALTDNARAEDCGNEPVHTDADLQVLQLAVDIAARAARESGCNVDDLVGPNVGQL